MNQKDLDDARRLPGLYVIEDSDHPDYTLAAVVICEAGGNGRMFALKPSYELSNVASAFLPTTFISGGPYSVRGAQERQRQDALTAQQIEGLRDEVEFWKDIALRSKPALTHMHQCLKAAGFAAEADDVGELIARVADAEAAIQKAKQTVASVAT